MGIIVGYIGVILAAGALLLAWPAGWLLGGYRRAAILLAVLLAVAGAVIAWLEPIVPSRPETAIWPVAAAGAGVLVLLLLAYAAFFSWLWRFIRGKLGRGSAP